MFQASSLQSRREEETQGTLEILSATLFYFLNYSGKSNIFQDTPVLHNFDMMHCFLHVGYPKAYNISPYLVNV